MTLDTFSVDELVVILLALDYTKRKSPKFKELPNLKDIEGRIRSRIKEVPNDS